MKTIIKFSLALLLCGVVVAQPTTRYSLLSDLAGPDDVKRSLAKQLLRREGASVVPNVLPLLDHDDPTVWNAADNLLADIIHWVGQPGREADRTVVTDQVLGILAAEESDELKRRILRHIPALAAEGHDLSVVGALLKHETLGEKARVALVNAGTTEAVEVFAAALKEANQLEQIEILHGLGQMEHPAALPVCEPYLHEGIIAVRMAAAHSMAWTGDPWYGWYYGQIFDIASRADVPREARDAVLKYLYAMGKKGGNVTVLMRGCKGLLGYTVDPVAQGGAMALLGQYGDEQAIPLILSTLNEDNAATLGPQAVTALAWQQGRAADAALLAGYETLPIAMRPMYMSMLGRRDSTIFIPLLSEVLKGDDETLAQMAMAGLIASNSPAGLRAVVEYAETVSGDAQVEALQGVETLTVQLAEMGQPQAAGKGFYALYRLTQDEAQKTVARDGLRRFPVPEAASVLVEILKPDELVDTPVDTLLEIVRALREAGMKDQVKNLEQVLTGRLGTTAGVQAVIAYANETETADAWKNRLGFLRTWDVVGPFKWNKTTGFQNAPFDVNAVNTALTVKEGDVELQWTDYVSDNVQPIFDLWDPMAGAVNACAFAHTRVTLKEAVNAQLRLGSDDGVRAWVNGVVVHENNVDRGVALDSDIVDITLKAGENTIVVQIVQNGGGWGFVGRLTDATGLPLEF
mgnify:CR=1 FL=1